MNSIDTAPPLLDSTWKDLGRRHTYDLNAQESEIIGQQVGGQSGLRGKNLPSPYEKLKWGLGLWGETFRGTGEPCLFILAFTELWETAG